MPNLDSTLDTVALARARGLLKTPLETESLLRPFLAVVLACFAAFGLAAAVILAPPVLSGVRVPVGIGAQGQR
ncbi:MAG: hypothetical protein U1E50_03095 [Caulobacteraceae bacterium]